MEEKKIELERYFQKGELIPAIIQNWQTKEVLMLAYMNRESLALTLESGTTWFFSRSRGKLWHKGETSGNFQYVKALYGDCDDDTLLVLVDNVGPACHTGNPTCFFTKIRGEENGK